MIKRSILPDMLSMVFKQKAIIVLGPRQSGKTTLLKEVQKELNMKTTFLNCDDAKDMLFFENQSITSMKANVGQSKLLIIDEAQRVENIGLSIKLLVDNLPDIQVIASGSSSFELANSIKEPLTGRKYEYHLYPISFSEMTDYNSVWEEQKMLSHRLVYGMYPEIITHQGEEDRLLTNLAGSYLYKDIFSFQDLRKPELLDKLIRALALQIGSEVSYTELAQLTNSDHNTIQRYIQLLENAYIIFRLPNYSNNQRNEIKRSRKIYFYDNGIRNALLNDFRPIELRDDIGKIWENYCVSERVKLLSNNLINRNFYFWRNIHQSEVDYIEIYEDKMNAFEFKWNPKKSGRAIALNRLYPHAVLETITPENYRMFLSMQHGKANSPERLKG